MTTTHHAPHKSHGPAGATHAPQPIDPERDIDAKSTSWWVMGSAVVLFISLYFLLPLFDAVLTTERNRKINDLPTAEWNSKRQSEQQFLNGAESPGKRSIEAVMREMAPK